MTSGIYWIYQVSRDRAVYVGSTGNISKRWREHRSVLKHGAAHNRYFQRVWNKYGEGDFEFKVLEECALDKLIEREQFWADAIDPICNMAEFVENPTRGKVFSDEHRRKLSQAAQSRGPHGPPSAETRQKLSDAQRGKVIPEEQRAKMRLAQKGRKASAETLVKLSLAHKGYRHTAEARAKISIAMQGNQRGANPSDETRQKMREAAIKAWARRRSREKE